MKNIIFLLIILFFINISLFSQNNKIPRLALRTMFASLIDPVHPNATIGLEYNLNGRHSIAIDYSYILNVPAPFDTKDEHSGFIIKPCFKVYKNEKRDEFFECDFFWKKLYTNQSRWIGQNIQSGGVPAYYKKDDYTLSKDVFGFNIKYGQRVALLKNKVLLEPYFGIGIRFIGRKNINNPDEILTVSAPFYGDVRTNKTYWGVSFPIGLRLVVPIK